MADRVLTHGVAGLLKEGTPMFYENLFGTRSLGRVSDLIAGMFQDRWSNGLQIRSLLLIAAYEARTGQAGGPLAIECGSDGERFAISVAFRLPEGGGRERAGAFLDRLRREFPARSEKIWVRFDAEARRIDLGCATQAEGAPSFELIEGALTDVQSQAQEYIQLADTDYRAVLSELASEAGRPAEDASRGGGLPSGSLAAEVLEGGLARSLGRLLKETETKKQELLDGASAWRWVQRAIHELLAEKRRLDELARSGGGGESQSARAVPALGTPSAAGSLEESPQITALKKQLAQAMDIIARLRRELMPDEKPGNLSTADNAHLRSQLQTALKQVEEFKRANSELIERLHEESKRGPDPGSSEDLKERLKAAMRMLADSRKQAEKLAADLETSRAEEAKLRSMLDSKAS